MADKPGFNEKAGGRSVSAVLLDLVFGEPVPQPEVTEHDDEQGWQHWLDAKARQEAVVDFEDTQPMAAPQPGYVRPGGA